MRTLYMEDCYLKEFDTNVAEANGKAIILDNTAFYPNSGGQPHDTGKLTSNGKEYSIVYVAKVDGRVSHEVDKDGLKAGDAVRGVIDWPRRHALMRMHTAAHLLSAVVHKEAGALITGNQLGIDQSRIDFSLEAFDKEKVMEYVRIANELASQALAVRTYFLSRDEAMRIPDVVKLAKALPPDAAELRIVDIGGVDVQADGGTHVLNTAEIGAIELVKTENKGKNNRRVYFTLTNIN